MECPILMTTVSRMSITIISRTATYATTITIIIIIIITRRSSAHDSNTTCTSSPNSSVTFSNVFYDTEGIP